MTAKSTTSRARSFGGRIGITLIITFVLLAIVPVAILLTLALNAAEQLTVVRTTNQQVSQAEVKTNDLRRWLDNSDTILVLALANEAQQERLVDILVSSRALTTAVTLQVQFLEDELAAQNTFTEFFLFNRDGQIRVSTDPDKMNINIASEPYVDVVLETGEPYVQPPYFDQTVEAVQMLTFRPIIDEDGQVVGGFGGRLNLEVLFEIMTTRVGLGETGETYLVNGDGLLITPSRFDEVAMGEPITSEPISAALAGDSDSGIFINYRGADVVGTYQWLPDLQLALLAEIEQDEVFSTLEAIRTFGVIASFIAIAVAILIGVAVTLWLTRPIVQLTDVALAVLRQDYTPRATITRNNEIGQLGHAFNQMTDKLVATIHDLDVRIEELKEANIRAQEAVRLKDEFLAVMSHELRTPLNASIGFLGLLQMGGRLSEQDLMMVTRARANNERLLELINNILDLSRIEAGRMNLMHEKFDLSKLLERIYDETAVLAEEKQLGLKIKIDDDVPQHIRSDIDAIRKIITNLLANGIKFTKRGEVKMHVSREDNVLICRITDTGVGIPEHLQESIFESFRQVDASSRRVYGGSGLGLSIVKNLAEALGGTVSVQSTLNVGSTFTVRLPLVDETTLQGENNAIVL